MVEGASGFERIVTDSLDRLEGKVDSLSSEVGQMKAASELDKLRRDRIIQPLADWGLEDSVALKRVLEREKRQLPTGEQEEREAASDRRLGRVQTRFVIAGSVFAVIQSLFNPLGAAWHHLKGVHL